MKQGRKVYDPLTNPWSTDWWLALEDTNENIVRWLPVWRD